ncbi:MAG: hypothetical protein HPY85_05210 [Anaerolineae bacterium]|nr:hypothetical protein [Anaerolineae bacterium]
MVELVPIQFINESVEVVFVVPPVYGKTPTPPQSFIWQAKQWEIKQVMLEWKDYDRRGKSSHNMRPSNLLKAASRGSYGVGRFYYRVMTVDDRIFQLYFDRSVPREQAWVLYAEYSYRVKNRNQK